MAGTGGLGQAQPVPESPLLLVSLTPQRLLLQKRPHCWGAASAHGSRGKLDLPSGSHCAGGKGAARELRAGLMEVGEEPVRGRGMRIFFWSKSAIMSKVTQQKLVQERVSGSNPH